MGRRCHYIRGLRWARVCCQLQVVRVLTGCLPVRLSVSAHSSPDVRVISQNALRLSEHNEPQCQRVITSQSRLSTVCSLQCMTPQPSQRCDSVLIPIRYVFYSTHHYTMTTWSPAVDQCGAYENASTEKWSRNVGASIDRWRNHRWIALRNRHYKTPKHVNLRNNCKVGPSDLGWALMLQYYNWSYSTIILNKCYTVL